MMSVPGRQILGRCLESALDRAGRRRSLLRDRGGSEKKREERD
jgi:hypothetical protein